jgi:BirA family biotin operon repressor/biotin-[acetyl-CoA-carboxylase] ligase
MPATDHLDPDRIRVNLKTNRIGGRILVYDCTASTNDIAAEYAKNKENDGLTIFTEEQTAGRGRAGTKWHSGRGDSTLCSIVLTDCKCNAELLSLCCAVAVAEAVGKVGGYEAKVKWPNDVILNGKKVAGILLESKNDRGIYILGVGINCHQKKESFPSELQAAATSIDIESHSIVDRISLAKRLLMLIDYWLEVAETNGAEVTDRWRELSTQLGQRVSLVFNGKKYTGNCIGIDPEKGLILQLETGGVRMFDAAHTTIVK